MLLDLSAPANQTGPLAHAQHVELPTLHAVQVHINMQIPPCAAQVHSSSFLHLSTNTLWNITHPGTTCTQVNAIVNGKDDQKFICLPPPTSTLKKRLVSVVNPNAPAKATNYCFSGCNGIRVAI